jgi:small-conductance mechanosensitive channel
VLHRTLQVGVERVLAQYQEVAVGIATFLGVFLGVYLVGRLLVLPPVVRVVRARNANNRTIADAIDLYLRVLFVVIAVPLAIAAAGFSGVAAGSGVVLAAATLALGVAGQDVIGNLVSGVFLVADPDFNVGDYIEWESQAGTIERIDLRVTRVRTAEGEVIVVPNTQLTTTAVRRPFARDSYRLTERLTVGYTDDVDAVRRTLAEIAGEDPRVRAEPAPVVHVARLGESSIELSAWFWIDDPTDVDIAALRTAFRTEATRRLLDAGVAVAPAAPRELSGRLAVEPATADG